MSINDLYPITISDLILLSFYRYLLIDRTYKILLWLYMSRFVGMVNYILTIDGGGISASESVSGII